MESVEQNDTSKPGIPRIEVLPISALRPYPGNAKNHPRKQIRQIAENAKWNEGLLKIELNGILDLDVDFSLELTGVDTGAMTDVDFTCFLRSTFEFMVTYSRT